MRSIRALSLEVTKFILSMEPNTASIGEEDIGGIFKIGNFLGPLSDSIFAWIGIRVFIGIAISLRHTIPAIRWPLMSETHWQLQLRQILIGGLVDGKTMERIKPSGQNVCRLNRKWQV